MFGYIIAGQLPNTNFERVSETEFLSNLTVSSQQILCDVPDRKERPVKSYKNINKELTFKQANS